MYEKRCEDQNDLRMLRHDIINYAANGVTKYLSPQQIAPIPFIDNEFTVHPIRSINDALRLLKEFEN